MNLKVDLQSLVESHERPFMVIDRNFRVVAINRAFAIAYGTEAGRVIGRACHEVSHGQTRPCFEMGEECPYQQVHATGEANSCLHTHRDEHGHNHWVRVTAYPLRAGDGEIYLGETIQEISVQTESPEAQTAVRMEGKSSAFLAMVEQLARFSHKGVGQSIECDALSTCTW